MSAEILSVSELNNFIRDVLKSGFPQAVWVCGEIQEMREKGGHLYFTLSEKDESNASVLAKIGASIWVNTRPKLDAILARAENPFKLNNDIQVKLLCKVDFYPPFGQIRLIVESIDPVYTLGLIAQERLRLIAKLKQEGLFDRNKQLALTPVPLNIGLITSHDSAAYHDFIDELRLSGFGFKVFLADALMQGKNTEHSVVQAIKTLQAYDQIDAIVIIRGGGSVTELAAFDSPLIARAIAEVKLPVITGIGHEINTTIADLTAHTFAKTPTATAQFLIGRINAFITVLDKKQEDIVTLTKEVLRLAKDKLKSNAQDLRSNTQDFLKSHHQRLVLIRKALSRQPLINLKEKERKLLITQDQLKKTIQLNLQSARTKIDLLKKVVDMADPKNTLKRGFTITRNKKGDIVKSVKQVAANTFLVTQFKDGEITTQVT